MARPRCLPLWRCCAILLIVGGCAAPTTTDYGAYRAHMPRSVLVLPPLNQSVQVNAPYSYLSTVSQPLAEAGYYVFPVAVVDAFMKENGLPTPGEMHTAPLDKIGEVFGADAVLYVTDRGLWPEVSGAVVYHGRQGSRQAGRRSHRSHAVGRRAQVAQGSGDSGGGIIGMVITAAVAQMIKSTSDSARPLAAQANTQMMFDPNHGLLLGPYHPGYEADARGR